MGKGRQHFSPVTGKWEDCGARKRPCRYVGAEHRVVGVSALLDDAERNNAAVVASERRSFVQGMMAWFAGGRGAGEPVVASASGADVSSVPEGAVVERFGRLKVFSEDNVSEGRSLYVFGDLTSKEDAEALHAADLRKKYQNGECGVLASELWNRNPHVVEYYFFSVPEDREWGTHHFVKLDDGSYADSMGVWSEDDLVAYWRAIDKNVSLKVFEEGQPVPEKNPNIEVSNQKLFDAITTAIDHHFEGK